MYPQYKQGFRTFQATAKNSHNTMLCIKQIDTSMLDYHQYNSFDTIEIFSDINLNLILLLLCETLIS